MEFKTPEYYKNPNINKPIEEIWEDINLYTNEVLPDDSLERKVSKNTVNVLLPPMKAGNKLIKGLISSQGIDYLHTIYRDLDDYFYTIANSMWGSFPYSTKAKAIYTLYPNKEREEYYKKTHADNLQLIIPYQDADFTNEYMLYPIDIERDIDVLTVGRVNEGKNIDILLKALMYIDKKYNKKLHAVWLVGSNIEEQKDRKAYQDLLSIAGSEEKFGEYIEIIPKVDYQNLYMLYSRSKLTSLTSIFEGKNRSIQESLLCNTPVICFSCFNQYIRGNTPILPEGCAYYVDEFSPEAFGEKLYGLIDSGEINYNTRESALKHFGRAKGVENIVKSIPYFQENIPGLFEEEFLDNRFLNQNIYNTIGKSLQQFLYDAAPTMTDFISEQNNYKLYSYQFNCETIVRFL